MSAMMDLLVSPAFAQAAKSSPSPLASFVPIILIFGIFYLLVIRPQNKKMKEHRALISSVQKGDEVVTGGGIIGKVTKVTEGDTPESAKVVVRISDDVDVSVLRSTISQVLTKREPKNENKKIDSEAQSKKAANDNR